MSFTPETIAALEAPLLREYVLTREAWKNGPKLSYIEGWRAIDEANRIFGFDGWTRETALLERLNVSPYVKKGYGNKPDTDMLEVNYMAKVTVTAGGVTRDGTGFGNGQAPADRAGSDYELAIKEAETDATKRALMTFGNPFGLALYDKTQANVIDAPKPDLGVGTPKELKKDFLNLPEVEAKDRMNANQCRKSGTFEKLRDDATESIVERKHVHAWVRENGYQIACMPPEWRHHLKEHVEDILEAIKEAA